MRLTRRFWLTTGVALCLVLGGWLLGSTPLFVAAAGLLGWVLAMQAVFVRSVTRIERTLSVDQSLDRSRVPTGTETTFRLAAAIDGASSHCTVTARANVPVAAERASATEPVVTLARTQAESSITVPFRWETVGEHTVDEATVSVRDAAGLFVQEFDTGSTPSVTVESPSVGPVHVGQSGERLLRGVGEHESRGSQGGLSAEEIRKYVPGDAMKYVDWKATARLDEPHVREYEAESNRQTVLVVDHRSTMGDGPAGRTKLDHLRAVASAIRKRADADRDPIGYLTVGDSGVTGTMSPTARPEAYESCHHHLTDLAVTDAESDIRSSGTTRGGSPVTVTDGDPTLTRMERVLLSYQDHQRTLLPDEQLYNGFRSAKHEIRNADLVVICSDDTDPGELRETAGLARQNATEVVVFLTPSVAFDDELLAATDDAYERYRHFDQFRRELCEMDSVTAYEVAPPDRIESLLSRSPTDSTRGEVA
ncbi:DUF58 domain-containing protein [Haloarcula salina]|uniref:DUF58 domain-containing protein n=1 Tax=Haloarcula salina TaxID=1429914 RepID=UPI003C6F30AC